MIKVLFSLLLVAFAAEDSKLVKAVHEGTVTEVKALAKDPKELNWKDEPGQDALFYAVSLNDVEKVQALLRAGASTKNLYTDKKESLLFEASRLGGEEVLNALIRKDASLLKLKNVDDESAIFTAVREDQSKIVKLLAEKGLSLTEKNKSGKTPKDYADPKNKKMTEVLAALAKKK